MFIFEYLWNLVAKKKIVDSEFVYNPLQEEIKDDEDDNFSCQHDFMPLDSSQETLACIKCGFIVKRSNMIEGNYDSKFE